MSPSSTDPTKRAIIDRGTLVPMSVVASVLICCLGAYTYVDDRFDRLEEAMRSVEHRSGDRWRGAHMRLWVQSLRARNPNLDVPKVNNFLALVFEEPAGDK